MLANISNNIDKIKPSVRTGQEGMTLIEVVIAMFILTIGLIAVAAAVIYSLQVGMNSRNLTESKMLASATLEHIETLRNTNQLNFNQIANPMQVVNPPPPALQFTGFRNDFHLVLSNPGPDGILGSADDTAAPGDSQQSKFQRKITVGLVDPLEPNLKQITVTVQYPGLQGKLQEFSMTSYLSNQE